ncbi:MAG: YggS family pyridoxal phosphate-dependent enzyme [Nitrospinales bacterium]
MPSAISENLARVKIRLAEAASKSGRALEDIRLVVVSKTIPESEISEAIQAGAVILGESRVQEARQKIARIGRRKAQWHLIGHLQHNKVKYIFDLFDLVHSVDSAKLAETIHQAALSRRTVMPVLVQVNVSGEASKFGVPREGLEETLVCLSKFDRLRVQGLMTIPPYHPDPEKSRPYFAQLRELRDRMARKCIDNISLNELSMGMSSDFGVAIEEGATLARVGTAIFGERPAFAK